MTADDLQPRGDQSPLQVLVVGAGPAGLWLASALARRGVAVGLVDPTPHRGWPNTYGLWLDEIEGLAGDVPIQQVFDRVTARFHGPPINLNRPYGLVDNQAFQQGLLTALDPHQVPLIAGRVIDVVHDGPPSTVHLDDGRRLQALIVVDASGGKADLLRHHDDAPPSFQRALGMIARFDGDPLQGQQMVLMDYGAVHGAPPLGAPTFLYGMHLGGDRYFVEETVLVGPADIAFEALEDRLHRRLHQRGAKALTIEEREYCHIPMGGPLPVADQEVLGFGASAGFVHPATGYQMTRMLQAAPALARVISEGLARHTPPAQIVADGWHTLWPPGLRRARQLLIFGQHVMLSFDRASLCRFFESFFSMPPPYWRDYLSGGAHHRRLSRIMLHLFRKAPMGLRLALMRQAFGDGPRVAGALLPGTARGAHHG